jgi:hypothetical protein
LQHAPSQPFFLEVGPLCEELIGHDRADISWREGLSVGFRQPGKLCKVKGKVTLALTRIPWAPHSAAALRHICRSADLEVL